MQEVVGGMDIEFAAVVRFDFCEAGAESELRARLAEIYDQDGERFGGPVMGTGGTWRRTQFSRPGHEFDDLPDFEAVQSLIEPDCRHIIDTTTVAILSDDQLTTLRNQDSSRSHVTQNDLMESLDQISESLPSIINRNRRPPATFFYIEPTEEQDIGFDKGSLDETTAHGYLQDNRDLLAKFQFLLGHPIEFTGQDFITPQSTGADGSRKLTILNVTASYQPQETEPWGPSWLRRTEETLKPYFRTDSWLRHRRDLIGEIDQQTHGINDFLDDSDTTVESALSSEQQLEKLRHEWTDVYTKLIDEVAALRKETPLLESNSSKSVVTVSPPAYPGQEVSIIESFATHSADLFETVEADLDRVGTKLDRISQFIHDSVTARTASENMELQEDVKTLTLVLTVLTVVLAFVSLAQFL